MKLITDSSYGINCNEIKVINNQDPIDLFITQCMVKSPLSEPFALPFVMSKYVEWYNKKFCQYKRTTADTQAQFEISTISLSLQNHPSGISYS